MTQSNATDPNHGLVKIVFTSPDDGEVESMWAEPVGADTYKVRNTPWHIYGVNFEDVVRAHRATDGVLEFVEVVAPSGFSTFRIMRREDVGKPGFVEAFAPLKAMGCGYEQAFTRLYAIDVPPGTDLAQVTAAWIAGQRTASGIGRPAAATTADARAGSSTGTIARTIGRSGIVDANSILPGCA